MNCSPSRAHQTGIPETVAKQSEAIHRRTWTSQTHKRRPRDNRATPPNILAYMLLLSNRSRVESYKTKTSGSWAVVLRSFYGSFKVNLAENIVGPGLLSNCLVSPLVEVAYPLQASKSLRWLGRIGRNGTIESSIVAINVTTGSVALGRVLTVARRLLLHQQRSLHQVIIAARRSATVLVLIITAVRVLGLATDQVHHLGMQ